MTFKIQVTQVEIETSPSETPYFVRALIQVKNSTADGGKCHIKSSDRSYKIASVCVGTHTNKQTNTYKTNSLMISFFFFFTKKKKKKKQLKVISSE